MTRTHTFTREQIEAALDQGILLVRVANGNFWKCRRNGRTQTWKTRPSEFRIPIKAGFKKTGAFTQDDLHSVGLPGDGNNFTWIMETMCPEGLKELN